MNERINERIYLVRDNSADKQHLVRAGSRRQAVWTIAQSQFELSIPTTIEVLDLVGKGLEVQSSSDKQVEIEL